MVAPMLNEVHTQVKLVFQNKNNTNETFYANT